MRFWRRTGLLAVRMRGEQRAALDSPPAHRAAEAWLLHSRVDSRGYAGEFAARARRQALALDPPRPARAIQTRRRVGAHRPIGPPGLHHKLIAMLAPVPSCEISAPVLHCGNVDETHIYFQRDFCDVSPGDGPRSVLAVCECPCAETSASKSSIESRRANPRKCAEHG